jgi:hypothetical protein
MCHRSQQVRRSRISSRLAQVVPVARQVRVPVVRRVRVRVAQRLLLVLRAQQAHGRVARRTSPVAGAAGVEAAASPAAADVAVR